MWADVMARSLRAAGARPGDIVHIAFGYGLFTGGLGFHDGAERLGCTVVPASGGFTERQVRLIADFKPAVMAVTPSYMLAIADEFERQGLDARATSLRIGVHGAEPWTESMRAEIEARFDIQAVDVYGLSEVIGPGVSAECVETKDGLHIWEDHFYPEIVDPATGAVLPEGESGELVLTSLTKEACPVIRYRTRDLARLLPGTARSMRRMARVAGRSDDMLIIRGVNLFPTQIEEILLEDERLSPHYFLEVRREGRLDDLTVVVEAKGAAGDAAARAAAGDALAGHIRSRIGITVNVSVTAPGSVERSIGKAKRIVDLVTDTMKGTPCKSLGGLHGPSARSPGGCWKLGPASSHGPASAQTGRYPGIGSTPSPVMEGCRTRHPQLTCERGRLRGNSGDVSTKAA